jgi:hypothetical protein
MRIESAPNVALQHASVGLTHDEAKTLLANLASWERQTQLEGEWQLHLSDGERELTLRITNDPRDQRFA